MSLRAFLAPEPWLGAAHGPRYLALRRRLEEAIDTGLLSPGDPLLAEREIAQITGTSRVTVRRAIEALAREGRIEQRHGSGSFILGAPAPAADSLPRARLASLGEDLARRGIAVTTRLIEAAEAPASPDEMQALGLGPDDTVLRLLRLRLGDGTPLALEETLLPGGILAKPKKAAKALYAALETTGHRPVRALLRVGAAALGKAEAKHLGLSKGAPALVLNRTGYLDSGRPIEVTRAILPAGAHEIVADLRAGPPR